MIGQAASDEADIWGDESASSAPARVSAGAELGEAEIMFPKIDDDQIAAEIERLLASDIA
jgi:hypothetical protein